MENLSFQVWPDPRTLAGCRRDSAAIHGARAVARWCKERTDPLGLWVNGVKARRGHKRAIVALANKIARFAYQVIAKGKDFDLSKAFKHA